MSGPGDRASKVGDGEAEGILHTEGNTDGTENVDRVPVALPESKNSARSHRLFAREPGDLEGASARGVRARQPREGTRHKPRSQAPEESDEPIVPKKSGNSRVTPEDSMEGRGEANGKSASRNASRTQDRIDAPTSLERIGQRAAKDKEIRFSNLLSHIKVPLLKWAYQSLRKKAAPGVDGIRWSEYGENLDARLLDLQDRVQRGAYHPMPVRRVHIPKTLGSTRPIGIPALEDKIVQQAVRAILEPIYESVFLGFSYGFRPRRSPHDALNALAVAIGKRTDWVLDADIRSYFDTLEHDWMKKFLEHRIGDARLIRLLMKWLKAGVMEAGELYATEEGSAQGGIISPLMSNIYLHYVLDLWAHAWRKRNARKEVYIVRYADDFVMGFEDEQDALSMRHALRERFEKFGLELHPDKTRLIRFGRYARQECKRTGTKPETFDFLGFTHSVSCDKRGWFQLLRRTSKKKRVAKYASLREEIRRRRHAPVRETWTWINSVLRGHYAYYGVPHNAEALARFRAYLGMAWIRQLQRRSQRGFWSHAQRERFRKRWRLLKPKIVHPWPEQRFAGPSTRGGSPVREIRSPGSVRGAP